MGIAICPHPLPPLRRGEGNYEPKDVAAGEAASASGSSPFHARGWGRVRPVQPHPYNDNIPNGLLKIRRK